MPNITSELSQKELEAVREYSNFCGLTISELVRKALIREITIADGFGTDDPQYEYGMVLPATSLRSEDHKTIQDNYNKIRRILGWKEIKL